MKFKNNRGQFLFVHTIHKNPLAPNLIFICTPITSVTEFSRCYEPFSLHGFNVFALDFGGIGKSEGKASDLSLETMEEDLNCLIKYIQTNYEGKIYLFGSTGTGGVIAQYLVERLGNIHAFIQYGVCIYGDASPLGIPKGLLKTALPLLRFTYRVFPRMKVTFNPPKYEGYNRDKDNNFYKAYLEKDPDFFKVPVSFVALLLQLFLMKKSVEIQVPTFVFKTNHDRYFPKTYFDRYFNLLTCPKQMYEIDDVHNSYYFYPEEIANAVAQWLRGLEE